MEKDVREMKFRRWRQKGVDGEEWPSVINEFKTVRVP
jgi:hypothetical protein